MIDYDVSMFDTSKLRGRIVEKYGTCSAFFKLLSISDVQSFNKLNGKSEFSRKDVLEWSRLLDIDLKDVGLFFYALKV